jgi:hypoxanthine phosphoribosyltransferase
MRVSQFSNNTLIMQTNNKELVLDSETIQKRVRELGKEITKDYQDKDLVIIGVLKGAFVFMADLIRAVNIPLRTDFIQVSSYGGTSASTGEITLVSSPSLSIENCDILLVEDIIDTGLTMQWLANHFSEQGAASVRICSLIDKAERREHEITIDYPGFSVSKGFLIGYGLDFDENYRHLPAIYHLNI